MISTKSIVRYKIEKIATGIGRLVILSGICFVILFPLLSIFSKSLMNEYDIMDQAVVWIPRDFSIVEFFNNVKYVMNRSNYFTYLWETVYFVIITTLLHLISSCVTGYGFARFNFKGKKFLFSFIILALIIPPLTTVIPQFLHFKYFDIFGILKFTTGSTINLNVWILPVLLLGITGFGLKNGLYIFIFIQYFKSFPKELEEAAYIDGLGVFKTFLTIALPLAKSSIIIVSVFSIVWQFTDTFYTFFFTNNLRHIVNSLQAITNRVSHNTNIIGQTYSNIAIMLTILPLLIIYIIFQKQLTVSVERSGLVD